MDSSEELSQLAQQRLRRALGTPEQGQGAHCWVLPRAGLENQLLTVTLQPAPELHRISVLVSDPALPAASENTVFIMQSMIELDALIASIRRRTALPAGAARP